MPLQKLHKFHETSEGYFLNEISTVACIIETLEYCVNDVNREVLCTAKRIETRFQLFANGWRRGTWYRNAGAG